MRKWSHTRLLHTPPGFESSEIERKLISGIGGNGLAPTSLLAFTLYPRKVEKYAEDLCSQQTNQFVYNGAITWQNRSSIFKLIFRIGEG